jgi:hypothetical protein
MPTEAGTGLDREQTSGGGEAAAARPAAELSPDEQLARVTYFAAAALDEEYLRRLRADEHAAPVAGNTVHLRGGPDDPAIAIAGHQRVKPYRVTFEAQPRHPAARTVNVDLETAVWRVEGPGSMRGTYPHGNRALGAEMLAAFNARITTGRAEQASIPRPRTDGPPADG